MDDFGHLDATGNTLLRATPVLDKANLDLENTDPANLDFNLEQARFHFPYLERTSPAAFTFVVNTHLPDSTFIFPIAAEAFLVIKNYQHNSTLYNISSAMVKLCPNPLSGEDTTVGLGDFSSEKLGHLAQPADPPSLLFGPPN